MGNHNWYLSDDPYTYKIDFTDGVTNFTKIVVNIIPEKTGYIDGFWASLQVTQISRPLFYEGLFPSTFLLNDDYAETVRLPYYPVPASSGIANAEENSRCLTFIPFYEKVYVEEGKTYWAGFEIPSTAGYWNACTSANATNDYVRVYGLTGSDIYNITAKTDLTPAGLRPLIILAPAKKYFGNTDQTTLTDDSYHLYDLQKAYNKSDYYEFTLNPKYFDTYKSLTTLDNIQVSLDGTSTELSISSLTKNYFNKTITITCSDKQENVWNTLDKTKSRFGVTEATTTVSYNFRDIQVQTIK
jgi:hypothetical protein